MRFLGIVAYLRSLSRSITCGVQSVSKSLCIPKYVIYKHLVEQYVDIRFWVHLFAKSLKARVANPRVRSWVEQMDLSIAPFLYVLCRISRPGVVVETGVGPGVSSTFILRALQRNRSGSLISIDLPVPYVLAKLDRELVARCVAAGGPKRRFSQVG